jgi:hypothetical protein
MNAVNFQASVNNLTQMDRHQQDLSRTPLVNQEQNAEIARGDAEKRIRMPVQADTVEGKKINPEENKRNFERKKRRKKNDPDSKGASGSSGYILDVQA